MEIVAYVDARFISTLHELERELVRAHGLRVSFDELRLGPLLAQKAVRAAFQPDVALAAAPEITMCEVARALGEYRSSTGFKARVDLEAFLNWLASRRGATSPRSRADRRPSAPKQRLFFFSQSKGPLKSPSHKLSASAALERSSCACVFSPRDEQAVHHDEEVRRRRTHQALLDGPFARAACAEKKQTRLCVCLSGGK